MDNQPIRVLLVDDSPVILIMLARLLSIPGTGIQVVGNARDGAEALRKIPELDPQVICTDLQMPGMNGLELTRNVMARFPRPILVLSALVEQGRDDDNIFQLLEAGAVDVLPKPRGALGGNLAEIGKELIAKIKILAGIKTFTRHPRPNEPRPPSPPPSSFLPINRPPHVPPNISSTLPPQPMRHSETAELSIPKSTRIITIGASTGGPQALQKILAELSPRLSIPILCIQHVSEGFTEFLVNWLGVSCPLPVRVAKLGEQLAPGIVYFPQDTKHLIIDEQGLCTTTNMGLGAVHQRPSITLAFNSVSQYYGPATVGILLTGMGSDGADGLLNIRKAGGITIAQDEVSSVLFGMPKVAAEIGAAQHVMSLTQITKIVSKVI